MSSVSPHSNGRVNLTAATVLLLERNTQSLTILFQALSGFGVYKFAKCHLVEEAKRVVHERQIDLVVMDPSVENDAGYDFVRWLRTQKMDPNSYVPIILVSGHTQQSNVHRGLNAGASYVIVKPLAPAVLLERILWIAHENKAFIETVDYLGPDRRAHEMGPPPGLEERRKGQSGQHYRKSEVELL
jgi:DNA-binding response OmpR family regulator